MLFWISTALDIISAKTFVRKLFFTKFEISGNAFLSVKNIVGRCHNNLLPGKNLPLTISAGFNVVKCGGPDLNRRTD